MERKPSLFKIYFKKLFSLAIGALALYGITWVYSYVFGSFFGFFKHPVARLFISVGIPLIIMLHFIRRRRRENQPMRRWYLGTFDRAAAHPLRDDLRVMWSSADFRAELLSFGTVVLLYNILQISLIEAVFAVRLLSAIALFCLFEGLYAVIDGICWLVVYRTWRRDAVEL